MKHSRNPWEGIFPLPLTSMEQFHLLDEHPEYSNSTFAKFELEGMIDPIFAQKALDLAVQRHPILNARIQCKGRKRWWVWVPDSRLTTDWSRQGLDHGPSRTFDMAQEPGVHVYAGISPTSTLVLFHGHHSTCDGLGGIQFTTDWLRIYDNLVRHREPLEGLPVLAPKMLLRRNHLRLFSKRYLQHLWKQPIGLFGAAKFIFRKIRPLYPVPQEREGWNGVTQPAIIGQWVESTVTARLRQQALEQNVTFNSLVMTEFFLCLQDWRKVEMGQDGRDWIRLIVPMSIRDISDRRQTAINRATVVQVDRCGRDFEEPVRLLARLDREMEIIRHWQLGKIFNLAIRAMAVIPGMLARSARNQKCRGTAVYTNLSEPVGRLGLTPNGDSVEVGHMRLKSFDYVGPIRRGTPIYVSIQKHLERIRISMHYDPRIIDAEQARELLSRFRNRLERLSESPP
ncbi:MAG: hypothetical protein MK106_05305 [Mariniblastus sp.]|nr:hypothetical protein [Mariniblastus sp.]